MDESLSSNQTNVLFQRLQLNFKIHSISCVIETCSCLATMPSSLICCKARLVIKDFNFVCLHIIYKTIDKTTNEIIAVANRNVYSIIVKKKNFASQI